MAKNLKNANIVSIGHNSDHNRIIKEAADEIIKLKAERAEIQAQITQAKGQVKGAGIKLTDFNVALRMYELEAEDRNESMNGIKICFEALGIGDQGELFPAGGGQDTAP